MAVSNPAWAVTLDVFNETSGGGSGSIPDWAPGRFFFKGKGKQERNLVFIDDVQTGGMTVREYRLYKAAKDNRHTFNGTKQDPMFMALDAQGIKPWHARSNIHYITVVNCEGYTTGKGELRDFDVCLFECKKNTLLAIQAEENDEYEKGKFQGCQVRVVKVGIDKEASVGSKFKNLRPADLGKLFVSAKYSGILLSDIWDAAEASEDAMVALKNVFQVRFDEAGKLIRTVVPFNYGHVLRPTDKANCEMLVNAYNAPDDAYDPKSPNNPNSPNYVSPSTGATGGYGDSLSDEEIPF